MEFLTSLVHPEPGSLLSPRPVLRVIEGGLEEPPRVNTEIPPRPRRRGQLRLHSEALPARITLVGRHTWQTISRLRLALSDVWRA